MLLSPVIAAAAAVNGLAKNVLAFGPCLPSKFLLLVEMQYLPAGILSSFIPKACTAARLTQYKSCFFKYFINAFFYRLFFYLLAARNNPYFHIFRFLFSFYK